MLALCLGMAPANAGVRWQDDEADTDRVDESVIRKLKYHKEHQEWRRLFEAYRDRLRVDRMKVVSSAGGDRDVGFTEYARELFCDLPSEAFQWYEFEFNGVFDVEAEKAKRDGRTDRLERALDDYFFATGAEAAAHRLACEYHERGLLDQAAKHWLRILRYGREKTVPREAVVAGLLDVAVRNRSMSLLEQVRTLVAKQEVRGRVLMGGRKVDIEKAARTIGVAPIGKDSAVAAPLPYLRPRPVTALDVLNYPAREVLRGAVEICNDPRRRDPKVRVAAAYIPACVTAGDRNLLIMQDGQKLRVLIPERVGTGRPFLLDEYTIYKPDGRRGGTLAQNELRFQGPLVGVVMDGNVAYVNVPSKSQVGETIQYFQPFPGVGFSWPWFNSIQAYRVFNEKGRVGLSLLATSDEDILSQDNTRKDPVPDLNRDNFHFSWPFLVLDDRILAAAVVPKRGEVECHLVCLSKDLSDRKLRVLWHRLIAWVRPGQGDVPAGDGQYILNAPILVMSRGLALVQTNIGVVAALDPYTGTTVWFTRYPKKQSGRGVSKGTIRPPGPPIVRGSRIYLLPMDSLDLLVLDASTGKILPTTLEPPSGWGSWADVHYLVHSHGPYLYVSGRRGVGRVSIHSGAWAEEAGVPISLWTGIPLVPILGTQSSRSPPYYNLLGYRPLVHRGKIYVSLEEPPELRTYELSDLRFRDQLSWFEPADAGNLVVAGELLVSVGSERMTFWSSSEFDMRDWSARTHQSPANPEALFLHGMRLDKMETRRAAVRELACELLETFVRTAGDDPQYSSSVNTARRKLYELYMGLGSDAEKSENLSRSIRSYEHALPYARDSEERGETSLRLALAYEAAGEFDKAVRMYLDSLLGRRDAVYVHADGIRREPVWRFVQSRIEKIATDPSLRKIVEERVMQALESAQADPDSFLDVLETWPPAKGAGALLQEYLKGLQIDDPERRVAFLRRLRRIFPECFGFEEYRRLIAALEQTRDWKNLLKELKKLEPFHSLEWEPGPPPRTVGEYVKIRIPEVSKLAAESRGKALGMPVLLAKLKEISTESDDAVMPRAHLPLRPAGQEPPWFGGDREVLVSGCAVELWNLTKGEREWVFPYPGAYAGFSYRAFSSRDRAPVVVKVLPDSPAERAGLREKDVIESHGEIRLTDASLHHLLAAATPNQTVRLRRRGTEEVSLTLDAVPANVRYPILGAAYTADYRLVVAWEAVVACLDLRSGKTVWQFRGSGPNLSIRGIGVQDGFVAVLESATGQNADPFWLRDVKTENQSRLSVLKDSNGRLLYSAEIQHPEGGPLAGTAGFFSSADRSRYFGVCRCARGQLLILAGDRRQSSDRLIKGRLFSIAEDAEKGRVYVATFDPEGKETVVRAFAGEIEPIWEARPAEPVTEDGEPVSLILETAHPYLALVATTPSRSRIHFFTADRGKPMTEQRIDLDPEKAGIATAVRLQPGGDGLIVYATTPRGTKDPRGKLLYYSIFGTSREPLWEHRGVPYAAAAQDGGSAATLDVLGDTIALSVREGTWLNGEFGPGILFFSGGKKRVYFQEIAAASPGSFAPLIWRGRLYLVRRDDQAAVVYNVRGK